MRRKNIYLLDKNDKKAVRLLEELGMPKNLAKTLMYISHVDECYGADIEYGADLRQPEVSIAIRELRQRGWVKKRELKKKGKGRPLHVYKPAIDLSEILSTFEQEKIKEIKELQEDITELKNLIEER